MSAKASPLCICWMVGVLCPCLSWCVPMSCLHKELSRFIVLSHYADYERRHNITGLEPWHDVAMRNILGL
jgi:hypothetical protein